MNLQQPRNTGSKMTQHSSTYPWIISYLSFESLGASCWATKAATDRQLTESESEEGARAGEEYRQGWRASRHFPGDGETPPLCAGAVQDRIRTRESAIESESQGLHHKGIYQVWVEINSNFKQGDIKYGNFLNTHQEIQQIFSLTKIVWRSVEATKMKARSGRY